MSVVNLDNGLPLAHDATNADLAKALGLESWQLNRLLHERKAYALEPDYKPSHRDAGDALSIFGLAPIPKPETLEEPFQLPLGFVALLRGMKAKVLERRLAELGTEAHARFVIDRFGDRRFPGDGARTLHDNEIRAIAEDAAPAIDLYGMIADARRDPSPVFRRLADAMARVASQFESGKREKPVCAVPTIVEITLASWVAQSSSADDLPGVPHTAMSPRELVFFVARGERWEPWSEPEVFRMYHQMRALENGVYVAATNKIGPVQDTECYGGSCICNPTGRIVVDADVSEGLIIHDCDLDLVRQVREYRLCNRRPSSYAGLTAEGAAPRA